MPSGPTSIDALDGARLSVTVAAIGASSSSAVTVNDFDHEPWFATVPVKRWCAGKGVEAVSPAASATAAALSSRPAPQSESFPTGPASDAVPSIAARTSAWVQLGCSSFIKAAVPAT